MNITTIYIFEITKEVCNILEEIGNDEDWEEIIEISTKASKHDIGSDKFYINIFRALKALNKRTTIVNY